MATEEYSVGYDAGYQAGWNEAMDAQTKPPQRTWVGLTDEEIEKLECVYALWDDGESCTIMGIKDFARSIEAELKEAS